VRKSSSKKPSRDHRDDYETDCRKRVESERDLELSELRRVVSECEHCRSRLPEFMTKKPKHEPRKLVDLAVQTAPLDQSLIRMLEEKLEEINQHTKLTLR